jgi:hypothetical protein
MVLAAIGTWSCLLTLASLLVQFECLSNIITQSLHASELATIFFSNDGFNKPFTSVACGSTI